MADIADALSDALPERFVAEREIGRGGMANVYLAHDRKLDRPVAIKVLLPGLAASLGTERFLREIRIAAKLNHPNILPLLDSGSTEDQAASLLYYVMPFVEGGSLRNRLQAGRPLSIEVILDIVRPVAAALNHAHRHGVIHRDIKPENILFSEGQPVVSDFGIAKAIHSAGERGLTRSGFPIGTPGYMSPEQAGGKEHLDARTDVCGLACVTYEMIVGETPGIWPTPEEVRLGRMEDAPPKHRERLDQMPGRVEQVLAKGLAMRPAERYSTPIEFVEALKAVSRPSERLTDTQVRAILERASEDSDSSSGNDDVGNALTIGSVEQVGAQVGIAPDSIRKAAYSVGPTEDPLPLARSSGGASQVEFRKGRLLVERTIPGEISPAAYELMVREINTQLGFVGNISTVGNSLHWAGTKPGFVGRDVRVSLTTASGQTHVHIEEHIELRGASVLAPGWGVGGGIIASLGIWAGLGLPDTSLLFLAIPLGVTGAITTALGLTRGLAAHYRPQLQKLADRLEQIGRHQLTD
jgi:serine/threonine protein kinase